MTSTMVMLMVLLLLLLLMQALSVVTLRELYCLELNPLPATLVVLHD